MKKNLKKSLILSILFIVVIRLQPIWERTPGGFWNILLYLSIFILFVWLIVMIIKELIRLIKQRRNLNFKLFLPILIMTAILLDGMFNPLKIDLEKIYGQVNFSAYYEGTQNQAIFKLRENGKFDIHWTGVFFSDNFYTGSYIKNGDTIMLDFDARVPRNLNDTLIVKEEYIYRLKMDTLIPTHFNLSNNEEFN